MRSLAFGLALLLASCASWRSSLDVITPDELTIGRGNSTHYGAVQTHSPEWPYEGDSETTYAALTWDIPSFEDPALSREERRALRDRNMDAAKEGEDSEEAALEPVGLQLNIREGVSPPPMWAIISIVGALAAFFLLIFLKSRRSQPWG